MPFKNIIVLAFGVAPGLHNLFSGVSYGEENLLIMYTAIFEMSEVVSHCLPHKQLWLSKLPQVAIQ